MNDLESWLYLDGPEPELLRPTLEALSDPMHSRTQKLPVMDPSQGARRPPPDLTLQQYVAYRTELELWPEHSADFHRKHGVESEAAYQELVRLWEGRLAASPHVRAQAEGIRASCLEQARTMLRARSGA